MRLKLYVIPGSHPCETVEAALRLKGLDYERVDLMPGIAPFHQLLRFGRRTVPGLRVDSYKVVGSPLIMRTLDGLVPEPAMYPADPEARAAVEAIVTGSGNCGTFEPSRNDAATSGCRPTAYAATKRAASWRSASPQLSAASTRLRPSASRG